MSIEAAIYNRLSGFGALTALVSTRIYPSILPQNPTLPAVTYLLVSNTRPHAMGSDSGLAQPRIQVSAWAETYDGARSVADQLRAALQRWRGTFASVVVQDSLIENENALYEDDPRTHQIVLDFIVTHEE